MFQHVGKTTQKSPVPLPFLYKLVLLKMVTKEAMVENLEEHSLVAQRINIDHVNHVGGLVNIVYRKELLLSALQPSRSTTYVLRTKDI